MRYLSLCSGIEAASVAWEPLGWKPVAFAEVDPFASAVLEHHWPHVPNLGDINQIEGTFFRDEVDVLVGGTPCFPAGELVLTPAGYVPIETLRIGDMVIAENGSIQRITAAGSKQATVGELKILGRSPIRCTPNHPFLCMKMKREYSRNDPAHRDLIPDGDFAFVRADQSVGMYAARPLFCQMAEPKFPWCYQAERQDIVELAGWYVGTGYVRGWTGKNGMAVVLGLCSDVKVQEFTSRFKGKLYFHVGKDHKIAIISSALARWLMRHFGEQPGGKKIPYWLYKHEYTKDFLQGYVTAVGGKHAAHVKSSTVSKALAHGIADLYGNASVRESKKPKTHNIEGRTVQQRDTWDTTAWFEFKETARTRKINERWASIVRWFRYDPESEPVTVYNITVENEHTYIVNGIATHNCQAYSIAGLRRGMDDARGNLTMQFVRLANEIDPAFLVWENVPGVLSDRGNAFGCFLAGLAGEDAALEPPGGRWTHAGYVLGPQRAIAWRILDAQYFGLAQRRCRVFVVGCPREGADPRKILFEFSGMRRDFAPGRETWEAVAATLKGGSGARGWENGCECNSLPVARCLSTCNQRLDYETETLITAPRQQEYGDGGSGYDPGIGEDLEEPAFADGRIRCRSHWEDGPHPTLGQSARNSGGIGQSDQEIFSQRGAGLVPWCPEIVGQAMSCKWSKGSSGPAGDEHHNLVLAFQQNQLGEVRTGPVMGTLNTNSNASGRNAPLVCAPLTTSPHADHAAQESRLVLSSQEDTKGCSITEPEKSGFAPVPFAQNVRDELRILPGYAGALAAQPGMKQQTFLAYPYSVRRLTPGECEFLQGFPGDHTLIRYRGKDATDSARYKALGNSMPVPVMQWIGKRIKEVASEES